MFQKHFRKFIPFSLTFEEHEQEQTTILRTFIELILSSSLHTTCTAKWWRSILFLASFPVHSFVELLLLASCFNSKVPHICICSVRHYHLYRSKCSLVYFIFVIFPLLLLLCNSFSAFITSDTLCHRAFATIDVVCHDSIFFPAVHSSFAQPVFSLIFRRIALRTLRYDI